jgi:hypothetical protein
VQQVFQTVVSKGIIAQGSLYADSYDDLQRSKQELKQKYTEKRMYSVGHTEVEFTKDSLVFFRETVTYEEYKTIELRDIQ